MNTITTILTVTITEETSANVIHDDWGKSYAQGVHQLLIETGFAQNNKVEVVSCTSAPRVEEYSIDIISKNVSHCGQRRHMKLEVMQDQARRLRKDIPYPTYVTLFGWDSNGDTVYREEF